MDIVYTYGAYLMHHGIKGQKWGVRRYQNEDGTLTEEGKKRYYKDVSSNKEMTIKKGTTFYRVSSNDKSDANDNNKLYVNASPQAHEYFVAKFSPQVLYDKGKTFTHEYLATADIKLPSEKVMEKIELNLLKDDASREEIIESLKNAGYPKELAAKLAKPYSAGRQFTEILKDGGTIGAVMGAYGAVGGAATGTPVGVAIGAGAGGLVGFGIGAAAAPNLKKETLKAIRQTYGDAKNTATYNKLKDDLAAKGYNAMRDYNDRRAYGKNGNHALILFDSKNTVANTRVSKITADDYAEAYAKTYMKEHPKTDLSYNSLVKDGKKYYEQWYEQGLLYKDKKAKQDAELEKLKAKNEKE